MEWSAAIDIYLKVEHPLIRGSVAYGEREITRGPSPIHYALTKMVECMICMYLLKRFNQKRISSLTFLIVHLFTIYYTIRDLPRLTRARQ